MERLFAPLVHSNMALARALQRTEGSSALWVYVGLLEGADDGKTLFDSAPL